MSRTNVGLLGISLLTVLGCGEPVPDTLPPPPPVPAPVAEVVAPVPPPAVPAVEPAAVPTGAVAGSCLVTGAMRCMECTVGTPLGLAACSYGSPTECAGPSGFRGIWSTEPCPETYDDPTDASLHLTRGRACVRSDGHVVAHEYTHAGTTDELRTGFVDLCTLDEGHVVDAMPRAAPLAAL